MINGAQIRIMREHYPRNNLSVWIEEHTKNDFAIAKPITMVKVTEIYKPIGPSLCISIAAAQQLMDDLWECGLRPSEGSGSAGQLAAVQKHLIDMRQLLFARLNVQKPENK